MPGMFDHLLAGLLLIAWPVWGLIHGRDGMRELADDPSRRRRQYLITMAIQWAHFVLILGLWWAFERPWTDLGLGFSAGPGFAAATALTALAAGMMWRQWRRVRRDPEYAAELREQVTEMEGFLPETRAERRDFRALAVTAGICEEIAYRGFLLWFLTSYVHVGIAVLVMAVAFGAGHLYQGGKAAAQIAGIGVVAAILYLLSGSLWIPIVLHALLDLHQLAIVRAALDSRPDPEAAATA